MTGYSFSSGGSHGLSRYQSTSTTLIAWIAASVSAYAVNSARRASGKRSIACSRNSMPFMCGIR